MGKGVAVEGLLVLLAGVVIAIPVAVIYLLISQSGLKSRIIRLEAEIQRLAAARVSDPTRENAEKKSPAASPLTPQSTSEPTPEDQPAAARVIAERRGETGAGSATTPVLPKPPEPREPGIPERLFAWLAVNWFYVVSALSLALAGLFLVQYGVENGFLPPTARVLAALAFGGALIAGGEVIRRRFGDSPDVTTAYLPSVFSGAGLVSLFGGVTAARLLYGLIGVEAAFVGLAVVGALGVLLGWLHGPLLAGIGVIGAFVAPLFVGSDVPATPWLFIYFAVVAAVGLGIDTMRRWAWVSVLSVVLAFGMGALTFAGTAGVTLAIGFQVFALVIALLAVMIPARSVWPDHTGPMISELAWRPTRGLPGFPTLLAAGTAVVAVVCVGVAGLDGLADTFWIGVVGLALFACVLTVWSVRASALQDLALLPVVGLAFLIGWHGVEREAVWTVFAQTYDETTEADFPFVVTVLWGIGLGLSALLAGRALRPGHPIGWGLAAAMIAPAVAILLEVTWRPAEVIGAYPWALHAIVLGAVMVSFALRFARVDGQDRLRVSFFVLSALAAITFAIVLILSEAALTVALAVTVVVAAALDRRFNLPLMQVFISVGVVAVGARLVANPGLPWALSDAKLWELLLAYGGAVASFCAALWMLRGKARIGAQLMLDTGAWSAGGILASLLLFRLLDDVLPGNNNDSHWAFGLYAVIWLGLMVTQLIRLQALGGWLIWVRGALALVFGLIGFGAVLLNLTVLSPLLDSWGDDVAGLPVLNTLLVAYLLPVLVLAYAAWRLRNRVTRAVFGIVSVALLVHWAFATLRHVWQGSSGMELSDGFLQPELYSYTVAILVTGAALFYQSLARRSTWLRRAGLVVIGLAVAKVFLIDISDLQGLIRVLSLVVLGLSLAGLAWLNRWAQERVSAEDARPE